MMARHSHSHSHLQERIQKTNAAFPSVTTISPTEARAITTPVVWVDCRDRAERAVSTISVDAVPEAAFSSTPVPDGATVIAYCTIGYRSAQFVQRHTDAVNLSGGILAYIHDGFDVYDAEGHVTRKVHVWGGQFGQYVPEGYEWTAYSTVQTALQMPRLLLRQVFGRRDTRD